jgi:hypothetical protein
VLRGHAQVGTRQHLHAAGDAVPVHRRDDGLEDVRELSLGVVLVTQLVAGGEERNRLLQVHPRAEGPVAAGRQDRHPKIVVALELGEDRIQRAEHLLGQRIHGVGTIDGHDCDAIAFFVANGGG